MTFKAFRTVTTAAAAVALSTAGTSASAASFPHSAPAQMNAYDASANSANGWRHRRHRHRDGGIDAGDVIAGVLVLGSIAAIASAVSQDGERREYRSRHPRDAQHPERPVRYESRGIQHAVDMCVAEIERGRDRVTSVDRAERNPGGWNVEGALDDGAGFACHIDNDGRIADIELERGYDAPRPAGADPQYDDTVYERARENLREGEGAPRYRQDEDFSDDPRPAYPGGPLPGEEGYEEAAGRYQTVNYDSEE